MAWQSEVPFAEKRRARLENWKLLQMDDGSYTVIGRLYDHPTARNGKMVTTAKIQAIDHKRGLVETRTHLYTLGRPKE